MNDVGWIALSLTGRIGNKTMQALLNYFDGSTSAILEADTKELRQVTGVGPKIAQSIAALDLKQVESALKQWQRMGVHILTLRDDAYPQQLKTLDDAPPTLFVRGEITHIEKSVAIVGTRSPSHEARNFAQNLSTYLVERGYTIISGLALGIDSAAHFGAILHPEGRTGAVLGCGVLNIYPPEHKRLAETITLQGFTVCEVNPESTTSPASLVARNRIITGLSDGVIVIETAVDGGAMYAARFATQQNRPVYTIDSAASGNQALIAAGAVVLSKDFGQLPF
ncbi:MAG: DNA-protecting protein DprA [Anaerolineaceae bacterium]|nr:DNA-protecting protein DprA [Anaerolineaceae bacterium]